MPEPLRRTRVIEGLAPDRIPYGELLDSREPAILKGVAAEWELTKRGRESAESAIAYLKGFDAGRPIVGYTGAPEIAGRFFYNADMTGLNFEAKRVPFSE